MRCLLDTNLLLRLVDTIAPAHRVAHAAVSALLSDGAEVCITAQNLVEFWAVASRPLSANGLGWVPEQIAREIERLLERFSFLPDSERIFSEWQTLVATHEVKGKRTHDARLAAVMLAHRVTHLLTFNTADFAAFSEIILLDPAELTAA